MRGLTVTWDVDVTGEEGGLQADENRMRDEARSDRMDPVGGAQIGK